MIRVKISSNNGDWVEVDPIKAMSIISHALEVNHKTTMAEYESYQAKRRDGLDTPKTED